MNNLVKILEQLDNFYIDEEDKATVKELTQKLHNAFLFLNKIAYESNCPCGEHTTVRLDNELKQYEKDMRL